MSILLRSFTMADAERIAKLLNDQEVSRWTSRIPFPYSLQNAKAWLGDVLQSREEDSFAIDFNQRLVGCVSYWPYQDLGIEIGYWLGRAYWGQAIMSTALKLLLQRDELSARYDIYAKVMVQNKASQRVLEKCGFILLGNTSCQKNAIEVSAQLFVRRSFL